MVRFLPSQRHLRRPPIRSAPPEQQTITMTDNLAKVPATLIGYTAPPRNDPDFPAVDLLASVLGSGNSSRLAKLLIDSGEAAQAVASRRANCGPSLFGVFLVPNGTSDTSVLTQKYDEEVAHCQRGRQPDGTR